MSATATVSDLPKIDAPYAALVYNVPVKHGTKEGFDIYAYVYRDDVIHNYILSDEQHPYTPYTYSIRICSNQYGEVLDDSIILEQIVEGMKRAGLLKASDRRDVDEIVCMYGMPAYIQRSQLKNKRDLFGNTIGYHRGYIFWKVDN